MLCDRERLTKLYLDVLDMRLGVTGQATPEGDVVFDVSDHRYVVRNFAPTDPEFLVICMFFALDAEQCGADSTPVLLSVANAVNKQAAGAHVVVEGDCAIITCEMLAAAPDCMPTPNHLASLLPRCVSTLTHTAQRFFVDLELAGIASASAA